MTEKFNEERKIYTVSECLPTNYLFIIKSGKVLTFLWGKGPQSERPRKGTNRNHPIGGSGRTTSLLWHTATGAWPLKIVKIYQANPIES